MLNHPGAVTGSGSAAMPRGKSQPAGPVAFLLTLAKQWQLVLLSVPGLFFVLFNNYLPLWGWLFAFFKSTPNLRPDFHQFVGLDMFVKVFSNDKFLLALRNTLCISLLNLTFSFVCTIAFALLLNEIRLKWFKRAVQTISYLPYFVSWVVAASIVTSVLSPETGVVNELLVKLGILKEPVNFLLQDNPTFYFIVAFSDIWKETGWGAILYLAAITGIDPQQYEAATIDGAGRFRRMAHITLPGLLPTVRIVLILSVGSLLSAGFENILLLQKPFTMDYSEVMDTYIFHTVWSNAARMTQNIPLGTAAGVANSIVSFILVFAANRISVKFSGDGLF